MGNHFHTSASPPPGLPLSLPKAPRGRKEGSHCQLGRDENARAGGTSRTRTARTAAGRPARPPANTPSWPRPNRGRSTRPSRNRAEGVCLTGRDIPRVGADGGSGGGAGKPLLFGPGFLDSPVSYRSWRAPSIETILCRVSFGREPVHTVWFIGDTGEMLMSSNPLCSHVQTCG